MPTIKKIFANCRRFAWVLFVALAGNFPAPVSALSCAVTDSSGAVLLTTEAPPSCSELLLLSPSDFEALRNPFGLDPDFSVVYWSAGATLLMWALGLGAGSIFSIIKKAR